MINWEEQWQLFAPGFRDGYLPLMCGDKQVRLLPGPGFGDLSHETTQLMVEYLPHVVQETVVDVGCGSGILSLAAKALGAKEVFGIDICEEALAHARGNAAYNNLVITFCTSQNFPGAFQGTLLFNMIYSEQQQAWKSLPSLHAFKGNLVISGILREQQKMALELWKGWNFVKSLKKGKWVLMHFEN